MDMFIKAYTDHDVNLLLEEEIRLMSIESAIMHYHHAWLLVNKSLDDTFVEKATKKMRHLGQLICCYAELIHNKELELGGTASYQVPEDYMTNDNSMDKLVNSFEDVLDAHVDAMHGMFAIRMHPAK